MLPKYNQCIGCDCHASCGCESQVVVHEEESTCEKMANSITNASSFWRKDESITRKVLKKLNSLGLHFVPNPLMVIKEVVFDIYYAQRDARDILMAWKEGGLNSYKRKKAYDRIFEKHMQHEYPRKGDAVQVLMAEYRRRGETGYILNVKTINEGTNAEKLALVKFDKSGQVDWLPFKQEAAYSGVLPALVE